MLGLGSLIGAGVSALMNRGKKKGQAQTPGPVPYDQLSNRLQQPTERRTPAAKLAATNPPDAQKAASENMAAATQVAARTRRRAAAGNSGFLRLPVTPGQQGIGNTGKPMTLIGGY